MPSPTSEKVGTWSWFPWPIFTHIVSCKPWIGCVFLLHIPAVTVKHSSHRKTFYIRTLTTRLMFHHELSLKITYMERLSFWQPPRARPGPSLPWTQMFGFICGFKSSQGYQRIPIRQPFPLHFVLIYVHRHLGYFLFLVIEFLDLVLAACGIVPSPDFTQDKYTWGSEAIMGIPKDPDLRTTTIILK